MYGFLAFCKGAWGGLQLEFRRQTCSLTTFNTGVEIAALAVTAIAAGVAAYGAYSQAEEQKSALEAQAKNDEDSARVAREMGDEAVKRERRKARPFLESFASGAGGMGVVAREGSPLLAELDYANQSELSAQTARYGYTLQERDKLYSGYLAKRQAGQISPLGAAGMSLLQSAGSAASSYGTKGLASAAVKAPTRSAPTLATSYGTGAP